MWQSFASLYMLSNPMKSRRAIWTEFLQVIAANDLWKVISNRRLSNLWVTSKPCMTNLSRNEINLCMNECLLWMALMSERIKLFLKLNSICFRHKDIIIVQLWCKINMNLNVQNSTNIIITKRPFLSRPFS